MTAPTIQSPRSSPAPGPDLISLLLTYRVIYIKAIYVLFRRAVICHSCKFGKFLTTIQRRPSLGSCVQSLDFGPFNPFLIFSTAAERTQAQNLTSKTLMKYLQLTPFLQEFIAQEHIDNDITRDILAKLFFGMPSLRTIDFRGCSSTSFKQSFCRLVHYSWPKSLLLTQVSFHECLSILSSVFETILPRLHQVTQLDLAGTAVNDEALQNFPSLARLTHLNLSRCLKLSTKAIVVFLTEHPSIVFTLRSLCIGGNPLLSKQDVDDILQHLPHTIRSLSLKSINMVPSQVCLLQYIAQKLEHLSIGRGLSDIDNVLYPN
ncbi:Leucine Rich Repeat domain protein [Ilyonectria robusta]